LPPDAPGGLCVKCLFQLGLETDILPAEPPTTPSTPAEKVGDQIGRYKLLEQIGEGGCGVVYMAEQEAPVRRRVALKIIKLGMDTKRVIARFEAERQALALMEHPNIAKVLDAEATDTGRPYFVMELVSGVKITDYCDEKQLPTRQRLDLFIQICQAVQHAHQKGVIHRDLKPSNILVTEQDGAPVPKVIDFGIAKATGDVRLTDKTLFTAFDQFFGTPAYMSPEQAGLGGLDVDTRSDIYSLGVLLYELLTGHTPFDAGELKRSAMDETLRTIREKEPRRPSAKLTTLAKIELTTVAQHRQSEPARLCHALRGDLDWIVMKCLEKDRARRYETANGLARDIERHLKNEPVAARPPSRWYEFQKTVRRHKLGFTLAATVILMLAAGLGMSLWYQKQLRQEAAVAKQAEQQERAELWQSYLEQARSERRSGQAGQRFATLASIRRAVAIRPSVELRNEAIAALALPGVRLTNTWPHPDSRGFAVAYSDNLDLFAFERGDEQISVCVASNGAEIARLPSIGQGIRFISGFTPDAKRLAVSYDNNLNSLWDISSGKPVFRPVPGSVCALVPDGSEFAVSGLDSTLRFYSVDSGAPIRTLGIPMAFDRMLLRPDLHLIGGLRQDSTTAYLLDFATGAVRFALKHPAELSAMDLSPDGRFLAVGCTDTRVHIWDTQTGLEHCVLRGHEANVVGVGFNHAGTLLATSSWDNSLRLWDTATWQQISFVAGGGAEIKFSPGDKSLAHLQHGGLVGTLDVATSDEFHLIPAAPEPHREAWWLDVSPDSRLLAIAHVDAVVIRDAIDGSVLATLPVHNCRTVIFEPDGNSLLTSGLDGLALWPLTISTHAGKESVAVGECHVLQAGKIFIEAALSDQGRWVAAAQKSSASVEFHEIARPQNSFNLAKLAGVESVSATPDMHWAAAGSWQGKDVMVWNVPERRLVRDLPFDSSAHVAFSPDGRFLAAGGSRYEVWQAGTWRRLYEIQRPDSDDPICRMAFSPDSQLLAVVKPLREIVLLEAATGEEMSRLIAPHPALFASLRFSPDNSKLYALQNDQNIQVWDLKAMHRELAALNLDW